MQFDQSIPENEERIPTVSDKLLNKFRLYLSIVRQMKYELTEEVQKVIFLLLRLLILFINDFID